MKGKKAYTRALIKLFAAYAIFTGIVAALFFLFLVPNPVTDLMQQKKIPLPSPTIVPSLSPTPSEPTKATPEAQKKFCGGIAGIQCPTGYTCQLSGNYPDAGGQCVKEESTNNKKVYCTMEAKECPDGSHVGRSGPHCEFTACPKGI